jgi:thiamine-phosphate pyrophosphorylase
VSTPAAAGCQPLLISPPRLDPEAFAPALEAALAVGGSAGFLLRLAAPERAQVLAAAGRLQPVCAAHQVAFLLADDLALARESGADGIQLGGAAQVAAARQALGKERIIGAACRASRDAAMVAGDAGADYIAFGEPDRPLTDELGELVEWWSWLSVLPCLAEGDLELADCAALARRGGARLGPPRRGRQHTGGPAGGVGGRGGARPPGGGGQCPPRAKPWQGGAPGAGPGTKPHQK